VVRALAAGALPLARAVAGPLAPAAGGACRRPRARGAAAAPRDPARGGALAGGPSPAARRARAGPGAGGTHPTRGTHVLVPRERLPTDGAVIFTSPRDGRVMFLIPWPRFTVIGTTDLDARPGEPVRATRAEVRYLLDSANGLVPAAALGEDDVVSTWAGLRPLLAAPADRPSARSREERVERNGSIYTIAGGKLTGFRSMAERLGARIAQDLGHGDARRRSPTRTLRLRGALARPCKRPEWSALGADGSAPRIREPIEPAWRRRYAALVPAVQELCQRVEEGRSALDPETLLGEVDWAVRHEDCLAATDFFLRRTDLGHAPRATLRAAKARVLERLASALAWSSERQRAEAAELDAALDALHAWRAEPVAAPAL
jgi:glycerol-3-phosphate dehydrogenase